MYLHIELSLFFFDKANDPVCTDIKLILQYTYALILHEQNCLLGKIMNILRRKCKGFVPME